jgi:hypothetical protein
LTSTTIRELAAALHGRYVQASKVERGHLLDEFGQVSGYHRKSAIRLLRHPSKAGSKRGGRPKEFRAELAEALKVA